MADSTTNMPQKGEAAPDFEGSAQGGERVRLSELRGRKVALYFYPKDDTPGCMTQACNLRDGHQNLLNKGIVVIGVSPDDEASHVKFAGKYDLPFPLLADPNKDIIGRYGVWGEKNLYGKKTMGLKRTTFLIDEAGCIVHVFKRPKVLNHTREIMEKFNLA